jgi:N-acetylglucosaminyl-diphospho-decaprenol L-rhamnosyltransferase
VSERSGTPATPRSAGTPAFELVVVSYKSRSQIEGLLANLPADLPVCIVDNAAGVDGLEDLVKARPDARYLDGGGAGFAHAANLGALTSPHEYLVFGNPDSRPTIEDYREVVRTVAGDPDCASASATMVSSTGAVELGTAGWEPSLRRALVHAAGIHKVFPRAGLFAKPQPHEVIRVDWTTGACMAVRRDTFLGLGGFDERYYVYNEDVAFGRAARERGLHQALRTDVLVPHASGGSGAPSAEMMRLRGASMARYVSRYNGAGIAGPIRFALALGYVTRVLQQLAKRDVGRAREHVAYIQGLLTQKAKVGGQVVTDRA